MIPNTAQHTISMAKSIHQQKTINTVFEEVVKVLHAPYVHGDNFFMIFTGNKAKTEIQKGEESVLFGDSPSDACHTGSGTWTVTVGKDSEIDLAVFASYFYGKPAAYFYRNTDAEGLGIFPTDQTIVYEYKNYQPNGSHIHVTGFMAATYRSHTRSKPSEDTISFNQVGTLAMRDILIEVATSKIAFAKLPDAINAAQSAANDTLGTMVDTLEINGAYKATLRFTYKARTVNNVLESDYDSQLFESSDALFTANKGSKVEFTYDGETITLNKDQLKKLLHVTEKNIMI